jgi:hypothetical protein
MAVTLWEENIGWGSGSTFQTAAATGLMQYGLENDDYLSLMEIMRASSEALRKTHTFDLSEYIGNQGDQGPAGPRGLPGLPGLGTSFVPRVTIPSQPAVPHNHPYHLHDVPDEDYPKILILWSQVATAVAYSDSVVGCSGWAKFINETGNDRVLTIWLMYRTYLQGDPAGLADDGYGPANATRISEVVSGTIPLGGEKLIRVSTSFITTEYVYVDLYAQIDTYSGDDVRAVANHYGISGKGVFSE